MEYGRQLISYYREDKSSLQRMIFVLINIDGNWNNIKLVIALTFGKHPAILPL